MRDLVLHPESGQVLDFGEDDFGGADQAAIIQRWLDGWRPAPHDLICYQHRNHEHPGLYLQQRGELLIAAHWPGSKLAGSHEIHHGVSDEHKRQVEYTRRAGEDAGYKTDIEVSLRREGSPRVEVRSDAVIYGPQVNMGVEVQRSALSRRDAKARTTKARRAGVQPVWFSDNRGAPPWFGSVPGILMMDMPWDTLPGRRSVKVVSGVPTITGRRCRNMRNSECPDRRYGCNRWHPDYEPRAILVDDLAELVPAGELIPMLFWMPSGREHIFIASPNDKTRYEVMTGRSADIPLTLSKRERLERAERIACSADAGVVIKSLPPEPSPPILRVQSWARPSLSLPLARDERAPSRPSMTYDEALERLAKASREHRRARGASLRRHWGREIAECEATLKALREGQLDA